MTPTLEGQHWRLQDATDAQGRRIDALLVRPQQPLQLDFADGRVRVTNACNGIGGSARIDGARVVVGALIGTKMACADAAVMALDGEIGKRLEGTAQVQVDATDPPRLTWTTAIGDVLRFTGTPTPETRFGGPATVVFLEVAARTKPCPAPSAAKACLDVRELRYDAQGLPAGAPGPWRVTDTPIEGYTHEAGVRNVLRVKRFGSGEDATHVLDMVVESEMAGP